MANEEHDARPGEEPAPEPEGTTGSADAEESTAAPAGDQEPERTREQELEEQLRAAEQKAEENWNEFLRARAEIENTRRRLEKDVSQARRQGLEKLAGELLPVKDSLEMGLAAARESNADVAKLTEGPR